MLPYNTSGLPNGQGPLRAPTLPSGKPNPDPKARPDRFFVAGDVRANEHNVLTCMHTLFVREHNRICDDLACDRSARLAREIKALGRDEALFRRARRHVIAIEQAITYEEFLPALLGPKALKRYDGYKKDVDATIANVFSTAAYRLGHDMLSSRLRLSSPFGGRVKTIGLDEAFWRPERVAAVGIDVFLVGLAETNMEQINCQTVEEIRSHLFNVHPERPRTLLDLAALNIQRGREHGLPDYNQCRAAYGLKRVTKFEQITRSKQRVARLQEAYSSVDEIDPWIGGLCEDAHAGGVVGELFHAILVDQFTRLRDGDRFWYVVDPGLSATEKRHLGRTRLSDVIKRNTLINRLQKDVFRTR